MPSWRNARAASVSIQLQFSNQAVQKSACYELLCCKTTRRCHRETETLDQLLTQVSMMVHLP